MTELQTTRARGAQDALQSKLDDIRALLERRTAEGAERTLFARADVILAIVGSVLLPLGLVVIGLGWYGAAHTPFVFEQIPYLISGGLLGVGMVVAGGLVFFGSWLARLAEQDRVASRDLIEALDGLRQDVRAAAVPLDLGAPAAAHLNGHAGSGVHLVATPTGTMVHTPDCSVVARRDDLRAVDPDDDGYRACKICTPLSVEPA
jgi:hypothetical protein